MEPTVVSGPRGRAQWESDPPFPLGFHALDSDAGGGICPNESGQTGLDFRYGDRDHTPPRGEGAKVFQDKAVELGNLMHISDFSCGDLLSAQSTISKGSLHLDELSYSENNERADEISDLTLSWLFTPKPTDVVGQNSACEELDLTQEAPPEGSNIPSSQAYSPSDISKRNTETDTVDPFLLVDVIANVPTCPPAESNPGEFNPLGVNEELVDLSQGDQAGLPPSPSSETRSPETRDNGLSPADHVTVLPGTSRTNVQGLPDSCLSRNHISAPLECCEGSVPLLDSEVPDCDSGPSLCPAGPDSVICTAEPSPLTVPLAEDAFIQGDFTSETYSVETLSQDVMVDNICSEARTQGNESMALDLCSTADEIRDEETWDLKPRRGVPSGSLPDPTTELREKESVVDGHQLGGSDCHEVASFDFSVQDLNSSSPVAGWTSEQNVETIPLSKMVADDSLPMVSAVDTREQDVSPLKAVFDALDQDGDGFVRIEEFMEFAAAYGADQVKDLTKFLDPSGLGVISFEDFHRGISAISNGGPEPPLYNVNYSPGDGAVGCPEEYDEQNEVTDSAYLGSESTYSECETFTDEDTGALVPPEMHEDVETDSGIEATLHDSEDGRNRFSLNSELHHHSLVTVIGGEEEHFEDFGESNTSELLLESSVEGTEGEGDSPLVQPLEQVNGSSLLSPSAGKRLSSKKVARHLLQNSSMTLDTMSDLTRDILELADNDITDKVLLLERRVAELEKESEASGEQHARLRQENLQLVHRANALEEQLKEQEVHADEQLQQETRRHKEALCKVERETGLELENLQARLQLLDEENSELRSCVPCLRANIERLEEEKRKLQDETEATSDRLQEETESRRKMGDKLSHERHQSHKEKECTQELIEDLRKQLEHLQLYKLEAEAKRGRSPAAGLQEYQTRTREAELEQEIKRLKQDNRSLKEQNDELNGQIINLSIQGAKNLMSASFSDSLAAEINSVSRSELMEAIHKQEEINYRLQDYIDKIIVAIMESNPCILEVK
uniref:RAB11 family interacting protein 3 (class II) n=1 Tax=Scophthalmus maximus TaxID=52904 RepID=A0A8D3AQQ2_SCOMX